MECDGAERKLGAGEYALEALRRLSPGVRVYTGPEGSEDEVDLFLELNNAVGSTSKATDWALEVGLMFSFRRPVSSSSSVCPGPCLRARCPAP